LLLRERLRRRPCLRSSIRPRPTRQFVESLSRERNGQGGGPCVGSTTQNVRLGTASDMPVKAGNGCRMETSAGARVPLGWGFREASSGPSAFAPAASLRRWRPTSRHDLGLLRGAARLCEGTAVASRGLLPRDRRKRPKRACDIEYRVSRRGLSKTSLNRLR
jgi:hypothetical protein